MCDQGAAPDFFKATSNSTVKIHGCLVATNEDGASIRNIPSFKICKLTQKPCIPLTEPFTWQDTWQVKVHGVNTLIGKSTCRCKAGGKIEFMTSGQIPLPDDAKKEVKALQEQAQRELNDSGYGDSVGETGFVEGMIPVWGSGRDLINDVQTGDVGGALLNGAFLIWDVVSIAAGVVTFGAGTAVMQGAKAGLKTGIKEGAKAIGKKALQKLGVSAFNKLSKEALKKSVDDVARLIKCAVVRACFTEETLIHTPKGKKQIKNIEVGDEVYSYSEDLCRVAIRRVTAIYIEKK